MHNICGYRLLLFGLLISLIFGRVLPAILTIIGFVIGLEMIQANLWDTYLGLNHIKSNEYNINSLFTQFDTFSKWSLLCSLILLLIIGLFFTIQFLYEKLSLEEHGNFILFSNLRLPLSLTAALFAAYALAGNLGLSEQYNSVDLIWTMKYNVLPGILIFFITFAIFMSLNNYKKIDDLFSRITNKSLRRQKN